MIEPKRIITTITISTINTTIKITTRDITE